MAFVEFVDNGVGGFFYFCAKRSTLRLMKQAQPGNKKQRYLSRVAMYCIASNMPDKTSVTLSIISVSAF